MLGLLLRFDALGNHGKGQVARQADDDAHDLEAVTRQAADERPINLQRIDREALQVAQ